MAALPDGRARRADVDMPKISAIRALVFEKDLPFQMMAALEGRAQRADADMSKIRSIRSLLFVKKIRHFGLWAH